MGSLFSVLIILGIVQGVAEFIPVSSSGHLVILEQSLFLRERLRGLGDDGLMLVNVALHCATLTALIIVMRQDIVAIVKGLIRSIITRDPERPELKITLFLIIASIPAAIIGFALNDLVEKAFSSAFLASIFLIINGLVLIGTKIIPLKDRKLNEVGLFRSIVIGLFQAVAILPGISRSGMTITGGLCSGLEPMTSARFSFLMAIPVIAGAAALEGIKAHRAMFSEGLAPALGIAMAVTCMVGIISLKVILALVRNVRIYLFGIYTIAVGVAGLIIVYLSG